MAKTNVTKFKAAINELESKRGFNFKENTVYTLEGDPFLSKDKNKNEITAIIIKWDGKSKEIDIRNLMPFGLKNGEVVPNFINGVEITSGDQIADVVCNPKGFTVVFGNKADGFGKKNDKGALEWGSFKYDLRVDAVQLISNYVAVK